MTSSSRPPASARAQGDAPQPATDDELLDEPSGAPTDEPVAIVEHPDGFYWTDGQQAFGPFPTAQLASADRDRYDELESGEDEALRDAEEQLGIADWIDPDTGEPAQSSTPRIAKE